MGKYVLGLFLIGFLGLTLWLCSSLWIAEGPAEISGHILVAMVLGIVFTLAVGAGLMFLVFYSARKGYDEPPERERIEH